MNVFMLLALASLQLVFLANAQVTIGNFRTLAHELAGSVTAIDDRTFEVRNLVYDGQGPAAFFWVGEGDTVSRSGYAIPLVPDCKRTVLPAYNRETVILELPGGKTIRDIDYLSVWCETASENFGDVFISAAAKAATPAATGAPKCGGSDGGGTFPVKEGWNCEPLNSRYQVRWKPTGTNINFELVGKEVTPEQWMSFGVSGSQTKTQMVNSDVVITNERDGKFFAVDYFMSSQAQCANGVGVCPDTVVSPPGTNDVTAVSGNRTLDTVQVLFTRPWGAANGATDRAFKTGNVPTFVSWAYGPYNSDTNLPQFHRDRLSFPKTSVSFVMGRTPVNNCPSPIVAQEFMEKVVLPAWTRPTFSNVTDFTARIGPSGGNRGVTAITTEDSWGIAWYISETGKNENILIPAIAVERGVKYTFRVFGGNDPKSDARYHPMYITSDRDGGFATKGPAARLRETVYAGITNIQRNESGIFSFDTPAIGPICEITAKKNQNPDNFTTFEAYKTAALDASCENTVPAARAGILEWTVPENLTANEVYYQCATHTDLGFKLVVFNKGEVDQSVLTAASIVASNASNGTCKAQFKGAEVEFQGCQTDNADIQVYWNIVNTTNIETMFVMKSNGWAGLGWGTKSMVPADAVIGYLAADGSVVVDDFGMTARSSTGVKPAGKQNIINSEGESRNGEIAVRFTRPLSGEGIATLDPAGTADLIYAVGPKPDNAPALQEHSTRASMTVNLAARGASAGTGGGGFNRRAFFLSHGIMMIVAWAFLTPLAVVIMRFFKKLNPTTFQLHRGLNAFSVVVVLVAFIMAIVKGSRSQLAHMVIGILVTIFAIIQSIIGGVRPGKQSPNRKVWFIGHAWLGRVVLILGWVNIFLGIKLLKLGNVWFIVVGIVMGIFVLISIILSFLPGKFPITEEAEMLEPLEEEHEYK